MSDIPSRNYPPTFHSSTSSSNTQIGSGSNRDNTAQSDTRMPATHPASKPKKRTRIAETARNIFTRKSSRSNSTGTVTQPSTSRQSSSTVLGLSSDFQNLNLSRASIPKQNIGPSFSEESDFPQVKRTESLMSMKSTSTRASKATSISRPGKTPLDKLLERPDAENMPEVKEAHERFEEFYLKRIDRPGLIRMKWGKMDFDDKPGLGVPDLNYWMASKNYEKSIDNPKPLASINCRYLEQGENGEWTATTTTGGQEKLADGDYIFVRMEDGSMRATPNVEGKNPHSGLSGNAAYVRYAGEVTFKNGREVKGSPQSGTYLPDPALWAEHSGFKCDVTMPENSNFADIQALYEKNRLPLTPAGSDLPGFFGPG